MGDCVRRSSARDKGRPTRARPYHRLAGAWRVSFEGLGSCDAKCDVRPEPPKPLAPGLYVVATPIGNLRDITLRALDVLAAGDLVLAEDTRVSGQAAGGLRSVQAAGALRRARRRSGPARRILAALAAGARIALISDAGTPLVSDPGYRLVREAVARGSSVFPIPGRFGCALAALAVAGLPTDRFLFAGFPPPRSAARRAFFAELAPVRATLVFFEGGSRLAASLADMAAVFGPREAAVARELTKTARDRRPGATG